RRACFSAVLPERCPSTFRKGTVIFRSLLPGFPESRRAPFTRSDNGSTVLSGRCVSARGQAVLGQPRGDSRVEITRLSRVDAGTRRADESFGDRVSRSARDERDL